MPFWIDDLDTFLADFGVDVLWDAVTYKGIFHNEYEAALLFAGEIESRKPFVEVKESDFSAVTQADTVEIDSTTYHVMAVEPDGTGMLILRLSKI
jgi:hypothetical protein